MRAKTATKDHKRKSLPRVNSKFGEALRDYARILRSLGMEDEEISANVVDYADNMAKQSGISRDLRGVPR